MAKRVLVPRTHRCRKFGNERGFVCRPIDSGQNKSNQIKSSSVCSYNCS